MRASTSTAHDLMSGDLRLDASYHASPGQQAARQLVLSGRKLQRLDQVCVPNGIFIPGRFRRVYVDDPEHGYRWLSPSDMQKADLSGLGYISRKFTANLETLAIHKGWILLSRSGTIGNLVYVRSDMDGLIGSDDIIRIVPDTDRIPPGYLFAVLSSQLFIDLIQQKTYGAVIPHIEAHHVVDLPIPRLEPEQEQRIHELIEQAAELRVQANQRLRQAQERFYRQVLGIDPQDLVWKYRNEHAFAVGETYFSNPFHRLDGFHHVGYAAEAERYLGKTTRLGDLVEPHQPPLFKRPYTGESGIPFLSGIDLYDYYPKPHMYISRKLPGIENYLVPAGTILVQRVGQRYGLFGRPTILPKHLDHAAVTEHLFRLFSKNSFDRGFVYIWLSTEVGRRLLLKESFGTSMGVLAYSSFRQMPAPDCPTALRYSFETEVQTIYEMRERANEMEDLAQELLAEIIGASK